MVCTDIPFCRRLALIVLFAWAAAGCAMQGAAAAPKSDPDHRRHMSLADLGPLPAPAKSNQAPNPPSPEALRELEKGVRQYASLRFTEAAESFERAIDIDASLWNAHVMRARCALRRGETDAAAEALRHVVSQDPDNAAALQLLGEIDIQAARTDDGIRNLRLALRAADDDSDLPIRVLSHLALAQVLEREGYLAAAAEQWEAFADNAERLDEASGMLPDVRDALKEHREDAPLRLAALLTQLERHEDALRIYARLSSAAPADTSLRRLHILAISHAGEHERAHQAARQEFERDPSFGLELLRSLCNESGDTDACLRRELLALAENARDARQVEQLATLLREAGDSAAALGLLERLAKEGEISSQAQLLMAELLWHAGQSERAVPLLAEVLDDGVADLNRALAWLDKPDDADGAQRFAKTCSALARAKPDSAGAHFLAGRAQAAAGNLEAAEAALKRCIELSDELSAAAIRELVPLYLAARRYEDVITEARAAIERNAATAEIYLALGLACDALERDAEAEEALLNALQADPAQPEPLFELARAAERRRQYKAAAQAYARLLDDIDPRFDAARQRLIELHFNAREFDEAQRRFAEFEELGRSGPIVERCRAILHLRNSKAATDTARLDEYIAALRKIIADYPRDAATYIEVARVFITVRRFDEALAELDAALAIERSEDALRLRTEALAGLFRFDAAIDCVRELLTFRPRDLEYLRRLLEYGNAHGDYDAAAEALRRMKAHPTLSGVADAIEGQYIDTLIAAGRHDDAIAEAKQWLDAAPEDTLRRSGYLSALSAAGRHDQAVSLAETWLAADPTNVGARRELLVRLQDAGRHATALHRALDWLAQRPDDLELQAWLIGLCWEAKRWDDAIELARQGSTDPVMAARFEEMLVQTYLAAGRLDEAVDRARDRVERLERMAHRDDVLDMMGRQQAAREYQRASLEHLRILVAAQRYVEAERLALRMLGQHTAAIEHGATPDVAAMIDLRNMLSEILQATDRLSQAVEQLEEVIRLRPEEPGAANNLGYTLTDAGLDLERAEALIRASLTANPLSHATMDSLGWVRYKRGDFKAAVYHLSQALRVSRGKDPVIHDHLADACYRDGNLSDAERHWREALKLCEVDSPVALSRDRIHLKKSLALKLRQLTESEKVDVAPIGPAATSQPSP